jgi:FkbM family methyltransferase
MYKDILPHSLQLLKDSGTNIIFFDVGARNGFFLLSDISQYVDAYGFEPNPEEYEKLLTGKTDSALAGITLPHYKKETYSSYALSNYNGTSELYIYSGPGAGSLIEPNEERLQEIICKDDITQKSFYDARFSRCKKKYDIKTVTLDDYASSTGINYIDFLKIDVEGSEYEVIEGAKEILSSVGVIKVETYFIPMRKGQKMFSHLDLILRDYDFDLVRYEIDPTQIGYKERMYPIYYQPAGYEDRYGQPLCCDAVYVNRSTSDPSRAFAQAMVLLDLGYLDESLHILKKKTSVCDPVFFDVLKYYRGGERSQRIRSKGYFCVDKMVDYLIRLYQLARRIKKIFL